MSKAETTDQDGCPDVEDRGVAEQGFVAEEEGERLRPYLGAIDGRDDHNCTCEDESFSGTIKVAEIQGMCVVGLPGAEEHGQGGDKGSKGTEGSWAKCHGGSLEKGCESAIQGVDAVADVLSVCMFTGAMDRNY